MFSDKKIYTALAIVLLIGTLLVFGYYFLSGSVSMERLGADDINPGPGKVMKIDGDWTAAADSSFKDVVDIKADVFSTGNYFFNIKLNTADMHGQNAFLLNPLFSASKLWINGDLVLSSGEPGAQTEQLPSYKSKIIPYDQQSDELNIVIQVSNHSNIYGGSFLNWLTYGSFEDVVRYSRQGLFLDFIIIFCLLTLAVIHLFNYMYQRKFDYSLFLFLYLFLYTIYAFFTGRMVINTFIPVISGATILRVSGAVIILALPVMMNYIRALFPDEVNKKAIFSVQVISLVFALLTIFLPFELLKFTNYAYFVLKISGAFYLFFGILKAFRAKRKDAQMTLATFSVLLLCMLNDYLYSFALISSIRLVFAGVLFFALHQTLRLVSDSVAFYRDSLQAHKRLEAVIAQKETFFSKNSRELDKPIRNILELAESILKGSIGPLNSEQIASTSLIVSNGFRLSNMLNDILDFQKIKDDDIEIKKGPVNIFRVVQKVMNSCESLVAVNEIELESELGRELRSVSADERRIEQVFYNLVSNSIKHIEKGSIRIESVEQDENLTVRIMVKGSDLDEETVNTVFSAYEQGASGDVDDTNISDLSFAIAAKLLELHGSEIGVEAVDDEIAYSFSLDYWSGVVTLTEEEELEMDALINLQPVFDEITSDRNIEILISGKDVEELQVLKSQLSSMNYSVVPLVSGAELLERVEKSTPDLIVVDVKLSDMSGYEVCTEIRKTKTQDELPIILVINNEDVSDMMQGLTSGANDFLTRPYLQEEFLTRVNTHLQLSKISNVYSRFVPTEFLKSLGQENIVDVKLGDQVSREMTILFVDIRAFTNLSENMTPEENFKFINSYLSRFSPMITNNGGFVDKYIGDAIMALFPHKPENALSAAKEMIEHVNVYNGHRANCGYRAINIGIGIHTGNMILGIIGDEIRMQGTVISDAVNLASRIQDVTKLYQANVVISQETFVKLENPMDYNFRFLGRVKVKGKDKAVALFEIFDSDSDEKRDLKNETKIHFEEAIMKFSKRNFDEAEDLFNKVVSADSDDKTTQVFLERIKEMRREEKRDFLASL